MSGSDDNPVDDDLEDTTVVGMTSPITALLKAQKIAWLEHVQGPGAGQKILIGDDNAVVVGRGNQADVRIDSAHLSRMHVRFKKSGPQVRFEDLDSANGIYLNGTKAHSATLHEGDTVQIGDAVFLFHEGN